MRGKVETDIATRLFKSTPSQSEALLSNLEQGNGYQRCIAGRYCVQRAREIPGTKEGILWLERAENDLTRTISIDSKTGSGFGISSAKSMVELANFPIYTELIVGMDKPSVEAIVQSYVNGLEIGGTISQWADFFVSEGQRNKREQEIEAARRLIGCVSEVAVATLLHRYAASSIGDGTWFAIPSMFEEDYHTDGVNDGTDNWDIGVYTQVEEGERQADLSYRIQVKTKGRGHNSDVKPSSEIALIRVHPDLAINGEGGVLGPKIIGECTKEYESGGLCLLSPRIDQRTDSLLDILG